MTIKVDVNNKKKESYLYQIYATLENGGLLKIMNIEAPSSKELNIETKLDFKLEDFLLNNTFISRANYKERLYFLSKNNLISKDITPYILDIYAKELKITFLLKIKKLVARVKNFKVIKNQLISAFLR